MNLKIWLFWPVGHRIFISPIHGRDGEKAKKEEV